MALAATNLGFGHAFVGLRTVSAHLHLGFANQEWSDDFALQYHMFATVCQLDIGYRASVAKAGFPGLGWVTFQ